MRPPIKANSDRLLYQDLSRALPVSFTGDAINELSSFEHAFFDIKDWIWHIEIVNGEEYCIITARQQLPGASSI